ncbi:diacylglycerol kinase [Corynebacterium mastitidis]|uniref:Diacylglycerol kinase n=1 Tax=Corynebacterium mastitidis TaxID=161890 RepID=A0A2N0X877_9CORY|nr:diacylglycerol kinase [Corynebacterium mastitidis]MCH6197074.1 diacylglycerol kinase [Corynebacterium mastitidis]PKF68913.1 diacylglycerol kinase [Corynebacterium mastitidis]
MSNTYQLGQRKISRVALLTNPAAGKGKAVAASEVATRAFYRYGVDVVSISGSSPEASRELAREMIQDDSIDALVACGGDGLIGLALQEQAGTDTPLGIIPAGTGNDHAREYKIPLDPRRAAKTIVEGFTTRTDLGIMRTDDGQQRYFGTIACAGFDSLVTDRTNRIPWPSGQPRYVLAILIEFLNFHSLPTRITLDDADPIEGDVTLCAIGNTKTYGGGMQVCPDADHYDGLFDITVATKMSRRKAALNVSKIFSGDFEDLEEAHQYRARKVRVEMPGINAYADGDKYFACPVECEVVPGAGYYIVPRP